MKRELKVQNKREEILRCQPTTRKASGLNEGVSHVNQKRGIFPSNIKNLRMQKVHFWLTYAAQKRPCPLNPVLKLPIKCLNLAH